MAKLDVAAWEILKGQIQLASGRELESHYRHGMWAHDLSFKDTEDNLQHLQICALSSSESALEHLGALDPMEALSESPARNHWRGADLFFCPKVPAGGLIKHSSGTRNCLWEESGSWKTAKPNWMTAHPKHEPLPGQFVNTTPELRAVLIKMSKRKPKDKTDG